MYDFYGNPPNTRAQLREWLTTWLEILEPTFTLEHKGESFIQERGFRRAGYVHAVFRSSVTQEYIWWVCPDEELGILDHFPTQRFSTFDAMLNKVIEDYYISWKLTD